MDLTEEATLGGEIEPGKYEASIASAEVKDTRDGGGQYINVMFRTDSGATIFRMFMIKDKAGAKTFTMNGKEFTPASAGKAQLKGMLQAAGKDPVLKEVAELLGLRVGITVKIKESKDAAYDDKAEVVGFYKIKGDKKAETSSGAGLFT
jgi:hypothetical protein